MGNIDLSKCTDQQNNVLIELGYLNVNTEEELPKKIKAFLDSADDANLEKHLKEAFGEDYKNIEIIGYQNENGKGGFCGIAFRDQNGNIGFAFRGTENLDDILHKNQEDMIDNLNTGVTGTSLQAVQAQKFYEKYADDSGNNYLYGHSKGGELAMQVYVKNYEKIKKIHVYNPQPINPTQLSFAEIMALRNSDKVDVVVNEGDLVSYIGLVPYDYRLVKNNEEDDSFFGPHMLHSVKYDKDGMYEKGQPGNTKYLGQNVVAVFAFVITTSTQIGYKAILPKGPSYLTDLYEKIRKGKKWMDEKFKEMMIKAKEGFEKMKNTVIDLSNSVKNFISTVIENSIQYFNEHFNPGYKQANDNPQIVLDTYKLRNYADRLNNVNKRIVAVDGRMDSLYWRVGWLSLMNLLKLLSADIETGYNLKVKMCSNYLNGAAEDFENAEKEILKLV